MIAYVTVGADDMTEARRFYSAFLPALGYDLKEGPEGLSYVLPVRPGRSPIAPDFYVKPPHDGRPASAGNGSMVAFEVRSQAQVRRLHAAALLAGGSDEGQPGLRAAYGPQFYVGTCGIRKATRSRSFPATRTNRAATGRPRSGRGPHQTDGASRAGARGKLGSGGLETVLQKTRAVVVRFPDPPRPQSFKRAQVPAGRRQKKRDEWDAVVPCGEV